MRAIWKGAVSFGLVSVPVKVYAATGTNDVRFHQVHETDGGRIRYRRVCSVDGEEVPYPEIAKAYETEDGEQVVLTDEDMDQLPLSTSREIDVVEFVPADQVDPVLLSKAYYLEPDKVALKPYTLLREALAATDRVAVVKVALRQRESLAVLRVRDDVICLQTLLWPDEVREASFDVLATEVELRPQETAMAASLVESLAGDFDPSAFTDGYAAAVLELVEAKVSAGEVRRPPADGESGDGEGAQVVDLLAALQRSVSRARGERGGASSSDAEDGPAAEEEPAPSRRTTPARRTARAVAAAEEPDAAAEEEPAPARRRSTSSRSKAPAAADAGAEEKAPRTKAAGTRTAPTKTAGTKAAPTKTVRTKAAGTKAAKAPRSAKAEAAEAPARRSRKKSA